MEETFSTPKLFSSSRIRLFGESSSVFMTPPSSTSKPSSIKPPSTLVLPQTPSCLLSPAISPLNYDKEKVQRQRHSVAWSPPSSPKMKDILGDLFFSGFPMIARKILSYTDPRDLCSCLQVCKTWHHQVSSDVNFMAQVITYRKKCKEDAENLEKTYKDTVVAPSQRRALGTIVPNVLSQDHSKPVSVPFQHFPHGVIHRHRPCPNCQSPAKELNRRRAECTKCCFDFCQNCFKAWHEDSCTSDRSPKRPKSEAICGTKKSRKRLKRL